MSMTASNNRAARISQPAHHMNVSDASSTSVRKTIRYRLTSAYTMSRPRVPTLNAQRFRANTASGEPGRGLEVMPQRRAADARPVDRVLITTGETAYRRPDGVAVVPLALLGP